ncbi:DNA helicase protein [Dioscorea alata]|nr:DNA helicase protein [Dioscorea alata]
MKGKQSSEQSDISYKVLNCYKKGELHSLTVAEMKCFLASKKMKVGGKKEDLIQRINLLLS